MNNKTDFEKAIVRTGKELIPAEKMLQDARTLYAAGQEAQAEELLKQATILVQKAALHIREIPDCTGNPNARAEVRQILLEEHPVRMGFTREGWFTLRMEALARNPEMASKEYIRGFLYPAMNQFWADKDRIRYPKAVMVFRHVYNRNHPEQAVQRFNNAEVKLVTDTVAMYVLVDDSPMHCSFCHCNVPGDDAHTEVYVIPWAEFPAFLQEADAIPEGGLPMTDQVPEAWKVHI
jgi:hypothetical protein